MAATQVQSSGRYDYVGIFLSALCAVHCLATPILLAFLPALGEQFQSPWVHGVLLVFVVSIFLVTILRHYRMHKSVLPLVLGIAGIAVLGYGFYVEAFVTGGCGPACGGEAIVDAFVTGESGPGCASQAHVQAGLFGLSPMYLSITGGLLLITAHIFNLRSCTCFRKGEVCGHEA